MSDELNTPNEPASDEGVSDLSEQKSGSPHDGSDDGGDLMQLADMFCVDLGAIPDEARGTVEDTLRNANAALHSLREEDSLSISTVKDKAAEYDRMVSDPRVRSALLGEQPKQQQSRPIDDDSPLFPAEEIEAAVNSESSDKLSSVLSKGVEKRVGRVEKTMEDRLVPIERALTTIVEMQVMDNEYPGWRKDMPSIRNAIQRHPELSIRDAYEKYVVVPRYHRETESMAKKMREAREHKRERVANAPRAKSVTPTEEAPKVYADTRDAVLAAYEQIAGKG